MFATHYHSLLHDWAFDPRVKLGHMNCLVNNSDSNHGSDDDGVRHNSDDDHHDEDASCKSEEVTFLYKLTDGSSPRSYGINVARLAGLPSAVITLALKQSRLFEDRMNQLKHHHHQNNDDNAGVVVDDDDDDAHHSYHHGMNVDTIRSVYERLVSLASSTSSVHELSSVAMEMWRRYRQMKNM